MAAIVTVRLLSKQTGTCELGLGPALALKPTTKEGHTAAMLEGGENLQHSLSSSAGESYNENRSTVSHARWRGVARTEQLAPLPRAAVDGGDRQQPPAVLQAQRLLF